MIVIISEQNIDGRARRRCAAQVGHGVGRNNPTYRCTKGATTRFNLAHQIETRRCDAGTTERCDICAAHFRAATARAQETA